MNEITITIPGFSISAKTWGTPDKPPILALHGWLDNANSFTLLAPYLQDDFYLIAVDLPGHGHSSHLPEGCNYHFIDAVFIITELLHALNLEKVHLLGHSMGACLGSLIAGIIPERLLSLYLIEALGPFSAPAETACAQLNSYTHFLTQKHRKKTRAYDDSAKMALTRSLKGYVSLEIATILCERGVIKQQEHFYWRHDPRLFAPSPLRMTEEQVLSCLKNISTKTHLLLGNQGFAFDEAIMNARIKTISDITVTRLDGGHHIHMEQPEVISQLLAAFYQNYNN